MEFGKTQVLEMLTIIIIEIYSSNLTNDGQTFAGGSEIIRTRVFAINAEKVKKSKK